MGAPPPPPGRRAYRGLFWPAALILIGILALLVNTNVIPADRLYRLADLWPVLLILLGLGILIRRSAIPAPASTAAAALIVLLAVAGAAAYVATGPPLGNGSLDSSQPVGSVDRATLEVDVGGANITIDGDTSIGSDLYQAHIDYSGRVPSVNFDSPSGALRISQNNSGFVLPGQRFTLSLKINPSVPWGITINAGGTSSTMNLSGVTLTSLSLNTGGTNADITLGPPHASVPIAFNGAGLTIRLHRPPGTAASVRVSGAGVSLTFDGRHHGGLGSAEDSSGGGPDRYDVQVNGAGCNVTMDTNFPSD